MKTSSFFLGVLLGAAATSLISRNGGSAMLGMNRNGGNAGRMMEKARNRLMDAAFPGMGGSDLGASLTKPEKQDGDKAKKTTFSSSEKAENIKMLKEFIRNSPDVKREVEQILKETHTAVPGI
ncbi:hypothetical protein ACE3NQ_02150 [Paenibacillus terreus]|uniref:Uncharacterized protein n=1 Tax=Paenibacillus terreus TaxID=1387834 RepID=A0ABV5B215_9BACL